MQLASYHGTRPGFMGLGNRLIRFRLSGQISHSELLFEPGDGVDQFLPDGSAEPVDGAFWCVSSVGLERLPAHSTHRAGHLGGVRFKRIVPSGDHWTLSPLPGADAVRAASLACQVEGMLYDWQLILGGLSWLIPEKSGRVMCSELCAMLLGFPEAWRFDPCLLRAVAARAS